uniref:CCHC-type domain-containing protein n=1 Tax=Meloidogyne enterolobii TaxID=390850 RepID=A0A6V7WWN5_MELEN|nr:unnamed protein product [Meloidogyne enterolobii]
MEFPEFIVHPLLLAMDILKDYLEEPEPIIPPRPTNEQERHECKILMRSLKAKNEDIYEQMQEIRNCRQVYEERVKEYTLEEQQEFDQTLRASVDLAEAYQISRRAKKRHIKYSEFIDELDKLVGTGNETSGTSRSKGVILPKLELKMFDGYEWENFWPLYEATIHNDKDLDPIQKMSYLDSLLRGEPKKVVQGLLPFSEANYDLAVDLLKSKYGKNEKIIRDLHNKLSSIPESRSIEDDIVNQVEVERVCRQLEHYNQDLKSPQIFLALEQKMSKKVLLKYLDLKQNEGTEPWTTELYRKCYAKAVEHCQMINEIYRKGKKVKEVDKKSSKVNHGEPLSPTMNFAIRYQPKDSRKPWRASDEGPLRPGRERERERRQDRKNRSRREFEDSSSRSSLYSSVSSNTSTSQSRNGRNQKGSPWPRDTRGKERFIRGESSSNSRSPARYPCQLCQGKHFPLDCDKYKTIEERKRQIQELAFCYICLKKGHNARECPRYNLPCFLCKRPKHNVALCGKRVPKTEQVTLTMYEKEVNDLKEVNSLSVTTKGIIKKPDESFTLLKCVEVTIYNPQKPNLRKRVIVFLDPGSEKSYITKKLGEELELEATGQANFNISGLGGVQLGTYESQIVEFGVKGKNCDRIIKARAIEKVMRDLKFIKYRKAQLRELSENKIKLKPDNVEPEVLIGNDYYDTFHVSVVERLANGFFINDSSLGEFLSGEGRIKSREKQEANKPKPSVVLASVQEEDIEFEAIESRKTKSSDLELNKLVEKQINLETIGLADANNDEDKIWLEKFKQNLKFNGERYEVKLIWNDEVHNLPNNYVFSNCTKTSLREL